MWYRAVVNPSPESPTTRVDLDALPRRSQDALRAIGRFYLETGTYPTFAEVGTAIGADRSNAALYVRRLVDAGVMVHIPRVSRGVRFPARAPLQWLFDWVDGGDLSQIEEVPVLAHR
jgi:SOS-response transcriptional repressor LexA